MVIEIQLDRLNNLMRTRGLGPGELASRSAISYDYIYKIRKGNAPNMSAIVLGRLAHALGTTTDYLLGLSSDPLPPSIKNSEYGSVEFSPEARGHEDYQLEIQLLDIAQRLGSENLFFLLKMAKKLEGVEKR